LKPFSPDHRYDDMPDEFDDDWDLPRDAVFIMTMWGHYLFETEFIEVMTICLICGNGVNSCTCDE